jgi:hypothetical protein
VLWNIQVFEIVALCLCASSFRRLEKFISFFYLSWTLQKNLFLATPLPQFGAFSVLKIDAAYSSET